MNKTHGPQGDFYSSKEEFCKDVEAALFRYLKYKLKNIENAKDAQQDVFNRMLIKDRWRNQTIKMTWSYVIRTANSVLNDNFYRKKASLSFDSATKFDGDDKNYRNKYDFLSSRNHFDAEEKKKNFVEILKNLNFNSEVEHQIFKSRFFDNFSNEGIMERYNISERQFKKSSKKLSDDNQWIRDEI